MIRDGEYDDVADDMRVSNAQIIDMFTRTMCYEILVWKI